MARLSRDEILRAFDRISVWPAWIGAGSAQALLVLYALAQLARGEPRAIVSGCGAPDGGIWSRISPLRGSRTILSIRSGGCRPMVCGSLKTPITFIAALATPTFPSGNYWTRTFTLTSPTRSRIDFGR